MLPASRITHHASRTTRVRERATFGIDDAVRHGRHVSPRHDRHALTMRPAASAPARFPRPSSPRCRELPAPLRPLPEHERRAGDSSNECLPPRRPPAGSRCAPARATNAPRVAPTHAAVKRTETRARALLRHTASRPPCPRVDRSKTRRLAGRAFDRPFHTAVLAFPRLSQKYPQTGRSYTKNARTFVRQETIFSERLSRIVKSSRYPHQYLRSGIARARRIRDKAWRRIGMRRRMRIVLAKPSRHGS
ncbi:sensor kinase protein [Burkholderia pseudomallei]|nr:sensor kinase protein [Burkholderia pseudomallei]